MESVSKSRKVWCREKPMFEDSLIESGNKLKTKRLSTTILSFLCKWRSSGF